MAEQLLYKYLDVKGGLAMLEHHNLQFTNATCLNDPFDSHPALFDYSDSGVSVWEEDDDMSSSVDFSENYKFEMENLRKSTWICSLSKVHNSLLMWSYYNMHAGICIGIDMEKLRPNLSKLVCPPLLGVLEFEVKYDEIVNKPSYFNSKKDYWGYQVSTKARAWEHEQEVRLTLLNPSVKFAPVKSNNVSGIGPDLLQEHCYSAIELGCFESVYLGANIDKKDKMKIIKAAKKLNPVIKLYQMTIDPEAFRLKEESL